MQAIFFKALCYGIQNSLMNSHMQWYVAGGL